jgi:hypothetical protein
MSTSATAGNAAAVNTAMSLVNPTMNKLEIKNNLKTKAKTEKDKETVKPTVINDSIIK